LKPECPGSFRWSDHLIQCSSPLVIFWIWGSLGETSPWRWKSQKKKGFFSPDF
jgi:hypothetical protein